MIVYLPLRRDFSCKRSDVGEQYPSGSTGDCCLDILGETAASAEPGKGSDLPRVNSSGWD